MKAHSLKVCATDLFIRELQTRIPFRYGITEMVRVAHLVVRVTAEIDGQRACGFAADHLAPKWFTKNPATSFAEDREQMIRSIRQAGQLALGLGRVESVFAWWSELYAAQALWAQAEGMPALLAGFGVSLIERASVDAFSRATATPFSTAVRQNTLGIRLGQIHPELGTLEPSACLPLEPARNLILRHTVGLGDPLTDAEILPADRVEDGLPQSLEASIERYGLTYFKIKLGGDIKRDRFRLRRLAELFGSRLSNYAFTLDGNENYQAVAPFRLLWEELLRDEVIAGFLQKLLFVEQPLNRDVALQPSTARDLHAWSQRPPLIIDESDSGLQSFATALESGYIGTSHKNCKGVFKGIANAALLFHRRSSQPCLTMSAEDLCNVGPFALTQDLAVVAGLGISHVERNGHHYMAGLQQFPRRFQEAVLAAHPDLFSRHPSGFPTLDIQAGKISIGSVVDAPFGTPFDPSQAELEAFAQEAC